MKLTQLLRIILITILVTPHVSHADNTEVTAWTQQVLLATLSAKYDRTANDLLSIRRNYTNNAWEALSGFFSSEIQEIRNRKLTLNPYPLTPATISDEGVFSGIKYWRINQSFALHELNMTLGFSVIVIKANNPPYLIQSINIVKN
ncbi:MULTISPECIES: DotI/IcmL/TraM family protein [unclassified Legionella]|uniref:DotI/IcmL/TraM family protein n=1 Tax=unclassified Legionella TaxID=2622702 RepID=UPI001055AE2B|nr:MULTISPECIES: DotI/IcmL/TraM family protein [unclassified Legionella]MDI9818747.1 DotI/IcmL/TraM family protein [Legionella sp. PL877]